MCTSPPPQVALTPGVPQVQFRFGVWWSTAGTDYGIVMDGLRDSELMVNYLRRMQVFRTASDKYGLAAVSEHLFGVTVPKEHDISMSDWQVRSAT